MVRRARGRLWAVLAMCVALPAAATALALRGETNPIVGSAAVGQFPQDVAVDARRGHAFVYSSGGISIPASGRIYGPSTLAMLDTRTGARLSVASIGVNPEGIAVDARLGRVYVVSQAAAAGVCVNPGMNSGCEPPYTTDVVVFDTASGRRLRARSVLAPPNGTSGTMLSLNGLGAIAIDEQAGRVFVVSRAAVGPLGDARVAMLDAASGAVLRRIRLRPGPLAVAVAGGAHRVFVSSLGGYGSGLWAGGALWLLDSRTGRLLRTLHLGTSSVAPVVSDERTQRVFALKGSPLGGQARGAGQVLMLDPRTGALLKSTSVGAAIPFTVAVDERDGRVYVSLIAANGRTGSVLVLDGRSGAPLRAIPVDALPLAMAAAPRDGRLNVLLESARGDNARVLTLDARTGRACGSVAVGTDASALAFDTGTNHTLVAGIGEPPRAVDGILRALNVVRAFVGEPAPTPPPNTASLVTTLDVGR
jgi:DNA-binding beta-propeller fold protein YncE